MGSPDISRFPSFLVCPLLAVGMGAICAAFGLALVFAPPKPNGWLGVRTPWTYADESIWAASHRALGWGLIASGLLWLVYCPAGFIATVVVGAGSLLFSWWKYAARYGTGRTWNAGGGWEGYRPMAKCRACGHLTRLNSPDELATRRCDECGQAL
jgi:hypothetical protein